jgi:hypothetical protein
LRSKNPLFCFMAREENLWFQIAIRRELHNEAYG